MNTSAEAQKNTRQIPINKEEIELLRRVFGTNEALLKALRCLFLGYELDGDQLNLIQTTFKGKVALQEAVQRKFYQKLSKDAPIGMNSDFWIGVEREISGQHPDTIKQMLDSRQVVFEMLQAAISLLEDPTKKLPPGLLIHDYNPKYVVDDPLGTSLIARNLYIQSIENGLGFLQILGNLPDEKMQELEKNSSK